MLQDLDKTLENILRDKGQIPRAAIDIEFEMPTSEWSARLNRPAINIWCFDVRENLKLRSMEKSPVSYNGTTGVRSLPPRRMDATYLITAWANKPEDEHQLLWRVLAVMKGMRYLRPEDCEGELRFQSHNIPLTVADMSEPKANFTDLWSVVDNQMRLGFPVTATLELDTDMGFEAPVTLSATIGVGQSLDPKSRQLDVHDVDIKYEGDEADIPKNEEES
jgi:hypothetical protein